MKFTFNISSIGGQIVRIDLKGRLLSGDEAKTLLEAADQELTEGKNRFVINLKELEFVNSAGLSSLISLLTKARNKSGEVAIYGTNKRLEELIILTKLNTVFNIFKSEDEALEVINE